MSSIGNRIKITRQEKGLSQMDLALATKVSQPTVANWENDSHIPRQAALTRLASLLEITPHWLRMGQNTHALPARATQSYLDRPIVHIPIMAWPSLDILNTVNDQGSGLEFGAAHDYIALSLEARAPFALIANDPNMAAFFPVGGLIIFERCDHASQDEAIDRPNQTNRFENGFSGGLENGKCYLFHRAGKIILRRWQSNPNRLEALPNQSAVDAEFVNTPPTPLAKALMSLRWH